MKRRSHGILGGSVALLLGVVAVAVWGLSREQPGPTVRLPNGEVLQLRAVTSGTTHQWARQTWWQRLLGPLVPQKYAAKPYLAHFYPGATSGPHLIFWFTGPGRQLQSRWDKRSVYVADEAGREYSRAGYLYEWRNGSPRVEYFSVPYPKRGHSVSLRFYDAGQQYAEVKSGFSAPPPAPASAAASAPDYRNPPPPEATTARCPVTARAGDVSVTLEELTTSLSSGGEVRPRSEVLLAKTPQPSRPGEIPWARAALRIQPPNSGWKPIRITVRDTSGTRAYTSYQQAQNGRFWFGLPGWICEDGGPVTARVMLQRDNATYRLEQLWTLPQVMVPKEGAETKLAQTKTVQGVKLQVHALTARGTPTGPGRRDLEKSPYVRLRASSLGEGRLLSVWAVDERGRRSDAELKAYGGRGRPYDYRIRMPIAREARRVDLHFAVHSGFESQLVDLVVQPGFGLN